MLSVVHNETVYHHLVGERKTSFQAMTAGPKQPISIPQSNDVAHRAYRYREGPL